MSDSRVALVLGGGGARGAYEAGALSVLLPMLEARGERPSVLVGTSVGAINAAYLASSCHLGAEEATAGLIRHWRQTNLDRVVRPIIREQVPLLFARVIGELLGVPNVRVSSLLNPEPIRENLERWHDWEALQRNIADGDLHAIAVVATAVKRERTVVFCDSASGVPSHRSRALDYVATELMVEHVQAAAAIPLLFPPVRVERPPAARGWYVDGGARLNTPIKPALDLGADRLAVLSTAAVREVSEAPQRHDPGPPGLGDGALNMLHGKLVDPVIEDLRTLANINEFFAHGAPAAQRYRAARGKAPYREVPYLFIGPRRPGAIGELASDVFRSRYSGLKALRAPGLSLLSRLLGASRPHSELFSYLFFDLEFIDKLIAMGAEDAHSWLNAASGPQRPWRLEPLDAFVDLRPAGHSDPGGSSPWTPS